MLLHVESGTILENITIDVNVGPLVECAGAISNIKLVYQAGTELVDFEASSVDAHFIVAEAKNFAVEVERLVVERMQIEAVERGAVAGGDVGDEVVAAGREVELRLGQRAEHAVDIDDASGKLSVELGQKRVGHHR